MTTKGPFYPYFFLGIFLFCWISFPKSLVDRVRAWSVGAVTPFAPRASLDEFSSLRMENQYLRSQIEAAYQWLLADQQVNKQCQLLQELEKETDRSADMDGRAFFQRRIEHLKQRLRGELVSLPAQVIYRNPVTWSSSIWVNVGEEDNGPSNLSLIAKNSPVLAGGSLVGVVDYVGRRQSRIRLITDAGLSPAVRAVRGTIQNREIAGLIDTLAERLKDRSDLFVSKEEQGRILASLQGVLSKTGLDGGERYLAKGELMGSSAPFWRSRGSFLKGIGFNFDYPDEEGNPQQAIPILQEGDFLVTSGLDGVFPADIPVGVVTKVSAPYSGMSSYEIEARPTAVHLNDLQTVFILPPVNAE